MFVHDPSVSVSSLPNNGFCRVAERKPSGVTMYALIGLIQFLLMLTQSRLMPAMQDLWEEKAVVSIKTITNGVSGIPVKENHQTVYDATNVTGPEEKQIPRRYHQLYKPYQPGLSEKRKPFARSFSDKLYLVFCQLKTEG